MFILLLFAVFLVVLRIFSSIGLFTLFLFANFADLLFPHFVKLTLEIVKQLRLELFDQVLFLLFPVGAHGFEVALHGCSLVAGASEASHTETLGWRCCNTRIQILNLFFETFVLAHVLFEHAVTSVSILLDLHNFLVLFRELAHLLLQIFLNLLQFLLVLVNEAALWDETCCAGAAVLALGGSSLLFKRLRVELYLVLLEFGVHGLAF